MKTFLGHFYISAILTIATLLAVLVGLGPGATVVTLVLIGIEVAFSFDNAIINAKVLEALGPNGIFINVSRGSVVDQDALIAALKARKIFSASATCGSASCSSVKEVCIAGFDIGVF